MGESGFGSVGAVVTGCGSILGEMTSAGALSTTFSGSFSNSATAFAGEGVSTGATVEGFGCSTFSTAFVPTFSTTAVAIALA